MVSFEGIGWNPVRGMRVKYDLETETAEGWITGEAGDGYWEEVPWQYAVEMGAPPDPALYLEQQRHVHEHTQTVVGVLLPPEAEPEYAEPEEKEDFSQGEWVTTWPTNPPGELELIPVPETVVPTVPPTYAEPEYGEGEDPGGTGWIPNLIPDFLQPDEGDDWFGTIADPFLPGDQDTYGDFAIGDDLWEAGETVNDAVDGNWNPLLIGGGLLLLFLLLKD